VGPATAVTRARTFQELHPPEGTHNNALQLTSGAARIDAARS
jgi:hypothetical protein